MAQFEVYFDTIVPSIVPNCSLQFGVNVIKVCIRVGVKYS